MFGAKFDHHFATRKTTQELQSEGENKGGGKEWSREHKRSHGHRVSRSTADGVSLMKWERSVGNNNLYLRSSQKKSSSINTAFINDWMFPTHSLTQITVLTLCPLNRNTVSRECPLSRSC